MGVGRRLGWDRPPPWVSEFQRLRSELQGISAAVRSVVVTSATEGAGTTTVAAHLALTMAEDGEKSVLLVDANLRAPAVHRIFGLDSGDGLSEWDGTSPLPVQKLVAPPNLHVLTAGTPTDNGLFALHISRLTEITRRVKAEFDFVIWDTPPVVRHPDAPLLGPLVDGVLVVIESDRTPADALAVAREQLVSMGGRLLGAVMNRRGRFIPRVLRTSRDR